MKFLFWFFSFLCLRFYVFTVLCLCFSVYKLHDHCSFQDFWHHYRGLIWYIKPLLNCVLNEQKFTQFQFPQNFSWNLFIQPRLPNPLNNFLARKQILLLHQFSFFLLANNVFWWKIFEIDFHQRLMVESLIHFMLFSFDLRLHHFKKSTTSEYENRNKMFFWWHIIIRNYFDFQFGITEMFLYLLSTEKTFLFPFLR